MRRGAGGRWERKKTEIRLDTPTYNYCPTLFFNVTYTSLFFALAQYIKDHRMRTHHVVSDFVMIKAE